MGPLPKPTKKQKGVVMFDPQVFLATVGAAKILRSAQRTTKSSLKVIPPRLFSIFSKAG